MSQRRSVSHGNERGGMSNAGSPRPENEMTHNNYPDDEDFDVRPSEVGKKRKRKSSVQKRMPASTATNLKASTIAMATTSTPTRTIQSKDQESNIGPSPTLAPLKDDMTEQLAIATERLRLANSELQSGRQRLKSERRNLARRIERLDRLLQETADMFPNTQDKLKKTEPQSKIEEKHIFGKTTVSRTRSECSDYSFIDDEDSVIDVDFDLYTDADVEANLNTDLADEILSESHLKLREASSTR